MDTAPLRYDGQVVVVTGAGNGLGKQHALFFASRGAKVVVNDLGGDIKGGSDGQTRVADMVANEIESLGGIAVANYDPVQRGAAIVKTAIDQFGRIDVLINNAGILRDTTLKNMKDEDWDVLMDVHMHGTMRTTRAAWPFMLRQGYGRIINTSSSSGLFGNFGQSNYAAAKMAILGFSKAVAVSGERANIHCNVLAPSAASRLTATVWTPEMMEAMGPERVVPIVGVLAHSSCRENGGIFLAGAGHFSKMRWERSQGLAVTNQDFGPDDVLHGHSKICDWKQALHPARAPESGTQSEQQGGPSMPGPSTRPLQGNIVLMVTADRNVSAEYKSYLEQLGAKVIAAQISASAETARTIVQDVLSSHGRVDVLINMNAEAVEAVPLEDTTDEQWVNLFRERLKTVFTFTKAVWSVFLKQKFGRVVNVTGTNGVYGGHNATMSSAAACGTIGFTKTIAREGRKYNITANAVAIPNSLIAFGALEALMAALSSEKPPATGQLYEAASDRLCGVRWQRSKGVDFEYEDGVPSPEAVAKAFDRICDFDDGHADSPATPAEGSGHIHTKGTESAKRIARRTSGGQDNTTTSGKDLKL